MAVCAIYDSMTPTLKKRATSLFKPFQEDIQWLGYQWDKLCFASDYFDQLYEWAQALIRLGDAYVDEQDPETIRLNRGI